MAHALILATGRVSWTPAGGEAPLRAQLPVEGRPVLSRVVAAFRRSEAIEEVVVVAPAGLSEQVEGIGDVTRVDDAETPAQRIRYGLRGLGLSTPVIIAPGDMALLTSALVDALVDAYPRGIDVAYPLVERESFEEAFPTLPVSPLRFADGVFVGSRLVIAKPQAVMMNYGLLQRACSERCTASGAVRLLGSWTALMFGMGLLPTRSIAAWATRRLDAPCALLPGAAPELAFALDTPEHLRLVQERLPSTV